MGFFDWLKNFGPPAGTPPEPETSDSITRAIDELEIERLFLEERREDLAQERVKALLGSEADLDRVESEQLQVARDLERVAAVLPELQRRLEEAQAREAQALEDARLGEIAELEARGADLLAEYGRHGARIVAILRELRDADQRHRELGARGHLPSRQGRQHQRDLLEETVILATSRESEYEVWGVPPGWTSSPEERRARQERQRQDRGGGQERAVGVYDLEGRPVGNLVPDDDGIARPFAARRHRGMVSGGAA